MNKVIKKMIGKTFRYRENTFTIKNIQPAFGDTYRVVPEAGKDFQATESQMEEDFKEIVSEKVALGLTIMQNQVTSEIESMRGLADILMDNIKKVKEDPKYVDQAKSVNESAKNIIELKKTQLEVVRLLKD